MARLVGPIDVDRIPDWAIVFKGDQVILTEPLCPIGRDLRYSGPFFRIIDENIGAQTTVAFDRAELVIHSHGIEILPALIDLTPYNEKYSAALTSMDGLIHFAARFFNTNSPSKCSSKPDNFCAITEFLDSSTGRPWASTDSEPRIGSLPFVVSFKNNGDQNKLEPEDVMTISVGYLDGPITTLQIYGDSPYATLFQNPFRPISK